MIKSLKFGKKQLLILFVFSALISTLAIVHGIFFDLAWDQVKRLSISGFLLTLIVIYPGVLFLEWVFDLNDKEKFDELEYRIARLEKKSSYKKNTTKKI